MKVNDNRTEQRRTVQFKDIPVQTVFLGNFSYADTPRLYVKVNVTQTISLGDETSPWPAPYTFANHSPLSMVRNYDVDFTPTVILEPKR